MRGRAILIEVEFDQRASCGAEVTIPARARRSEAIVGPKPADFTDEPEITVLAII